MPIKLITKYSNAYGLFGKATFIEVRKKTGNFGEHAKIRNNTNAENTTLNAWKSLPNCYQTIKIWR